MHGQDRASAVLGRRADLEAAVGGQRADDRVRPRRHLVRGDGHAEVRLDLRVVGSVALGMDDLHAGIVRCRGGSAGYDP